MELKKACTGSGVAARISTLVNSDKGRRKSLGLETLVGIQVEVSVFGYSRTQTPGAAANSYKDGTSLVLVLLFFE